MSKADIPVIHVFRTDFGDVRLTDAFVSEAEARWPDVQTVKRLNMVTGRMERVSEPRWVGKVLPAIDALMADAWARLHGPRVKALKSLRALAL